jgi:hypothetical protein
MYNFINIKKMERKKMKKNNKKKYININTNMEVD